MSRRERDVAYSYRRFFPDRTRKRNRRDKKGKGRGCGDEGMAGECTPLQPMEQFHRKKPRRVTDGGEEVRRGHLLPPAPGRMTPREGVYFDDDVRAHARVPAPQN